VARGRGGRLTKEKAKNGRDDELAKIGRAVQQSREEALVVFI
jgi:hypothetical protein